MPDIIRYRTGDRRAVDTLYRRVFGHDMANDSQLRWNWQYGRNPNTPPDGLQIWLAREGPTIVGQYAAMPVQLSVQGREIRASWGMDVMVAPERQRQGIGEMLFRTWDRETASRAGPRSAGALAQALREAAVALRAAGAVPDEAAHAARVPPAGVADPAQPARLRDHLSVRPVRRARAPAERPDRTDSSLRRAIHRAVGTGEAGLRPRRASRCRLPELEVRGTAPRALLDRRAQARRDRLAATRCIRHVQEPLGPRHAARGLPHRPGRRRRPRDAAPVGGPRGARRRLGQDADAGHARGLPACAEALRLPQHGRRTSSCAVKINALDVGPDFYQQPDSWHVTLGDSDQDR